MNLETFFIEVKLQTDEIKKGVDKAHSEIERLQKDFDGLSHSSDKVTHSFEGMARGLISTFAAYAGFQAFISGANGAIFQVRELGQASRELNVDVTALDAWGHAVQRTGGTVQSFQSSLHSLSEHFGTTNDIALRSLPRLADSFARLNPRQAQQYGKSLGLDLPTILLLQQGRREVEALVAQQQKLGLVTKEDIEVTRKFDNALYDASRAYQTFYRELTLPLLPGITKFLEYTIEHKEVVADAFKVMSVGLAALGVWVLRISGPIGKVAAAFAAIAGTYGLVKEDLKFLLDPTKESAIERITGDPTKPNATPKEKKDFAITKGIPALFAGDPFSFLAMRGGFDQPKTEVNIEKVEINTAATDAEGIAAAAKGSLQQQLSQLVSHVDNGVHS